jgi:hypothetical protein
MPIVAVFVSFYNYFLLGTVLFSHDFQGCSSRQ